MTEPCWRGNRRLAKAADICHPRQDYGLSWALRVSATERLRFEVQTIFGRESKAVILGQLASRVNVTEKHIETAFAVVQTHSGRQVIHLRMLEEGFAVAAAAPPARPRRCDL